VRLHPVLAPLDPALRGRAGVAEGRRLGRLCLEHSASLASEAMRPGAPHPPPASGDSATGRGWHAFPRNSAGAPRPYVVAGTEWTWSTTNTHGLAAAVTAPVPVAIDAEWCARPRLDAARAYFDDAELARVPAVEAPRELVLWTAKEVVLKLTGLGLAGLPRCRLLAVAGDRLDVELDGRTYTVHSIVYGQHVLALASTRADVTWQLHALAGVPA